MRRLLHIILLAAITAGAQDSVEPAYVIRSDIQRPAEQFTIERKWLGNNFMVAWDCYDGTNTYANLSDWSITAFYSRDQYSTAGVHIAASSVSNNRAYFIGPTNFFDTAYDNYWVTIRGVKSGKKFTFGTGRMIVDFDPFETAGGSAPVERSAWDWDLIGTYEGTWPIYAGSNVTVQTTTTGVVIHAAIPGGAATNGAWNASVAGASNLALAAYGATSNAAQAATNAHLLALAASNTAAAALAGLPSLAGLSNGVTAAALAATNADAKASQAQALGTNAYALASNALPFAGGTVTGAINIRVAENYQLANDYVFRAWRSTQGELDIIVRTNADEDVQILFESSPARWAIGTTNGNLSIFDPVGTGGGEVGVEARLRVLNDISTTGSIGCAFVKIGTNVLSNQGGTNVAYNGVGLRDGVGAGGGGGSPTQEEFTVTGDAGNGDWKLFSFSSSGTGYTNDQALFIGYNLTHNGSAWDERPLTNRVGTMIGYEPYYEYASGTGIIRQSEFYLGCVHTNQSPQSVLGDTSASRLFQFSWIWPGSSGYPDGGRSGNLSMDALAMSNATFSGLINVGPNAFSKPVRLVQQRQASAPGTNGTIASVRDATPWGGGVETNIQVELIRLTNSPQSALSLVMYGDNGQTTERYRFTPSALEASVGSIRQTIDGTLSDLFTNGWLVASILAPDNQYLNTNDIPRQFGWIGGQRNRFLPGLFQPGGTNVYGLVGGGGYSNAWLMSTAQGTMIAGGVSNFALQDISGAALVGGIGNSINNAKHAGWLGGRSCTVNGEASASLGGQGNTISGGWTIGGGRENIAAANYGAIAGYQNQIQAGALWSAIVGGRTNVIAGPTYAVIGGGGWNTIGSGGVGATIPGGLSNTVLSAGGFAAGNSAVVSATGTNSFMFNGAQTGWTNSTPRSTVFNMPGGFTVRGAEYGSNAGRGVLTGGVCVINLPFAMSDAAYSIHLTYATDAALLTPLSATGTTSAIYILGSGNNPFHWQVKGVAP